MQKKTSTAATAKSAQKKPTAGSSDNPAPARGATAKSVPEKGPAAKRPATATVAKEPARPVKEVSKTVVTKKAEQAPAKKAATPKAPAAPKAKIKGERGAFLTSQRQLLLEERSTYISSAEALKAQADSLALEHEPGDVQFDEEGGEGGTANVDREIDLYLSAQARATVVEIDRALQKIEDGTYGVCENCGQTIPDARLEALPYAALCVNCKSGGLSSRR